MRRLLIFPALFAAGCVYGWTTGLAWPVLAYGVKPFLKAKPCNDGDYMA